MEERSDASRLLDLIGDAQVRFWSCPNEHVGGRVRWDGDVAKCLVCPMTNETDPRLAPPLEAPEETQ